MKKYSVWTIVCAVFFALQSVVQVLSLAAILRLNMLPDKYLFPVILIYVFGWLLTGILLLWPADPNTGSKARRIIACILAAVIIALCAVAYSAVAKLHDTMDNITQRPVEGVTRQVYVRKDDPAQSIQAAAGYTFGIVSDYDTEHTQQAISVIEEAVGGQLTVQAFTTVPEMVEALYDGQCGAMILNSGYIALLEDGGLYPDFSDKTRVLYDAQLPQAQPPEETTEPTQPEETDATQETPAPTDPPSVTNTPFILYISGSDTRSYYLSGGLSDVNILVTVNPNTKQILLLNTPRDYYVPNPAGGGKLDKLTHCGVYGIDCSIQALSDMYDIQIDDYAEINFTGFKKLIDAVGGVSVYSDVTFTRHGVTIMKGENYLNGEQALVFARERYMMPNGDRSRGQNQMRVIKSLIGKLSSGTTILSNYAQILDSLDGLFVTSMEMDDISQLVKLQLDQMPSWNVQTFAVTGVGGKDVTYSMPGQYLSVMYRDEKYINYAHDLMNRVLAGEILTEADMKIPTA